MPGYRAAAWIGAVRWAYARTCVHADLLLHLQVLVAARRLLRSVLSASRKRIY